MSSLSSPTTTTTTTPTIEYRKDGFLFLASSVRATFPDGLVAEQVQNVTVQTSTPIGDQIILHFWIDDDELDYSPPRVVHFIIITPDLDWRRQKNNNNQTYAWKLDNAWMSAGGDGGDSRIRWNVESNVDSAIKVDNTDSSMDTAFVVSSMTFHFEPISLKRHSNFVEAPSKSQLVLENVKLGWHLASDTKDPLYSQSPCHTHPGPTCTVVDGKVVEVGSGVFGTWTNNDGPLYDKRSGKYLVVVVALAIWIVGCIFLCKCLYRRRRSEKYEQVLSEINDDLTLEIDDDSGDDNNDAYYGGGGSLPRSTIDGVVNETG